MLGQPAEDNITRRMRFASWITKATNTHSEYVVLTAFPLQQWLRERVSCLLYVHCLSCNADMFEEIHASAAGNMKLANYVYL